MGIFNKIKTTFRSDDEDAEKKESPKREVTPKEPAVAKASKKKNDPEKKPEEKKDVVLKEDTKDAYRVLVRPISTEKSSRSESQSKYIFEVSNNVNKYQIMKAMKDVYEAEAISVNVLSVKGKRKQFGRMNGKRKDWKKAIVTLKKGTTLDLLK